MGSAEFKAVDAQYGVGSPFWTANSALTGLLSGVQGGNATAGAIGGGVASGDTSGMVSAGNAARVEVENNSLLREALKDTAIHSLTKGGGAAGNGIKGSGKGDGWDEGGGCEGTREQCAVRDGTRGPGHTELPIADVDPTGGKLVNPDQSDAQGATNTGAGAGNVYSGPNDTGGKKIADELPNNTGNPDSVSTIGGTAYVSSNLQSKADALTRGEDIRVGSVVLAWI